jgi:outer membrane protein
MKKIYLLFALLFLFCAMHSSAQTKIGFISLDEVLVLMPEYKKADTALAEYNNMLSQQFAEYRTEYLDQDSILNSKDTLKYIKVQIVVRREHWLSCRQGSSILVTRLNNC